MKEKKFSQWQFPHPFIYLKIDRNIVIADLMFYYFFKTNFKIELVAKDNFLVKYGTFKILVN